jgi:trans-aconitate methyltransferase
MASTKTARRASLTEHEALQAWLNQYENLHIDVGTGDGTYALRLARDQPRIAVLGLDTHLGNLSKPARKGLPNLRFIECDAAGSPAWLRRRASAISINFPYGALFHAVTGHDPVAQERIFDLARPGARIELRVNASAGSAYGVPVEAIRDGVARAIGSLAPDTTSISVVSHKDMRTVPSTWAKRLAFGRPTEMVVATAVLPG